MTPPTVVWIRHATSIDGLERPTAHARADTPLSDRGRAETQRASDGLVELGVGRIVSSPLPRAWETARILADELGVPLDQPYPQLREWRAPDCVLGIAPADYPPQYVRWRGIRSTEPDTALPGGESLTAFARRAAEAAELVEYMATGAQRQVLVVAHVLLIGAVAAHAIGIREPGAVFTAATSFTLPPAGRWQHGR
ncbi:histidine phosphatase family protein [Amycolatopsis sp. H20-H5]|uniref:histidine phosphatase family protein n=1 Tax=Amycolatopsis sp. H20-H5 TaxID=3046309 RepID=UPI002DBCF173|nr:histidine phosphatase family protein [Amycolatopsis sp. H20-H5]MEC3980844.1 histidine phosphatase family protein [Amycolatopsis sp. H20-H5]